MTGPLITTTDLTAYRTGDPQAFVDTANAMVRSYCGWHIAPEITETIRIDSLGSHLIPLPSLHVVDVASVSIIEPGGTPEPIDLDTIAWSEKGWIEAFTCWPRVPRLVEVEFTHGYSDVPADLKSVALGIAARLTEARATALRKREMGPFREELALLRGGTAGGAYLSELDKEVLAAYRIPAVA